MRRILVAVVATFWTLGCAPARSGLPPVPACAAPASATPFDSSRVDSLAGAYTLILTADSFPSAGARTAGRLRLQVNGDARRPLVGSLEINLDAIFAPYSNDPRSVNPDAPGVFFDMASQRLSIGVQPNLPDGMSTSLVPALTWPDGFQGRWTPDYGIASLRNSKGERAYVGGTFCALRNGK
ncbi:MAG TPA: hypothetical protein VIW26_04890 [Gemmatimonadales bacterium]|jgi:hypothetical protein